MAKPKNHPFSLFGVRAWFRVVSWLSEETTPSALERRYPPDSVVYPELQTGPSQRQHSWSVRKYRKGGASVSFFDPTNSQTTAGPSGGTRVWRAYKEGRHFPSLASGGKKSPTLLERVEADYPGTADWLLTPFWELLDERPLSVYQLAELIAQMPRSYRALLMSTDENGSIRQPPTFLAVTEVEIRELGIRSGPWELGALACIVRIARFTGDSALLRKAITAVFWMLWTSRKHVALEADFERIWDMVVRHLQDVEYITPSGNLVRLPIGNEDLKRFDRTVREATAERRCARDQAREEAEKLVSRAMARKKSPSYFPR